jgi:hypothetical protein
MEIGMNSAEDLHGPDDAADGATAVPLSDYEPPRLVRLGQSNDLIRGNVLMGTWDFLQGAPQ